MTFSIANVAPSLAAHLTPVFPSATFYEDPNQQGTDTPCFFLQNRSASISPRIGQRFHRELRLDLTYLEDYNLPDLQARYQEAAEKLDEVMDTFLYSCSETVDGVMTTYSGTCRCYNREWHIDLDALHYKFDLQVRIEAEETGPYMEELTTTGGVTNGN